MKILMRMIDTIVKKEVVVEEGSKLLVIKSFFKKHLAKLRYS